MANCKGVEREGEGRGGVVMDLRKRGQKGKREVSGDEL